MRGTTGRRRYYPSLTILCAYMLLQHGTLALSKSTKLRRLRGYRESSTKKPPIHKRLSEQTAQAATARELSTMFENTETGLHVLQQQHQRAGDNDSRGPEQVPGQQEKIVFDIIEDGELVSEEYQIRPEDEHSDAHLEGEASEDKGEEIHFLNKEEPKGLYTGGKSSKPKVKGSRSKTSAEPEDLEPGEFKEEDEEVQEQEQEQHETETEAEEKEQYEAAPYSEAQHDELRDEEPKHGEVVKPQEEKPSEKPQKEEKSKREKNVEEAYVAEEAEAKQDIPPLNPAKSASSSDSPSKPGKESGKGESSKGETNKGRVRGNSVSSASPQVTEIHVGFQYKLKGTQRTASLDDFANLAKTTSHVCDYVFRHFFMDIEEVQFLSTDKLAIHEVKGPNYATFTIAAYFAADSISIPDQQQLTDIVTNNLLNGSTYYEYYLFLLENLEEDNAFHYTNTIELYSQNSKLTGPSENMGYQTQGSARLFKVAVPIVVLLLVSVVAALIYITWVESKQLYDDEDDEDDAHFKEAVADNRKILTINDGESTLPSHGGSSFTERRSFSDDSASISESSAQFVDDMPRKTKQVRVSPRVLYRTFNPGDFSSRVDFEEVSLQDEDEKLQRLNLQLQKQFDPKEEPEEEVSMTKLMDDFAAVLNSAPFEVRQTPEAGQGAEVVEKNSPDSSSPEDSWVNAPPRDASEMASQLNLHPVDVTTLITHDLPAKQRTRLKDDIDGASNQDDGPHASTTDRPKHGCVAKATSSAAKSMSPKLSPNMSPKPAFQNMNMALQRMARQRQPVSTADVDDAKSFFDDEYEEEVLEEEDEEEVSVYEEEVLEEEGTPEEGADEDLAAIEEALWGTRTPKPQYTHSGIAEDATKDSPKPTPPLPTRQVRDFWEKKSAKQETVRNF